MFAADITMRFMYVIVVASLGIWAIWYMLIMIQQMRIGRLFLPPRPEHPAQRHFVVDVVTLSWKRENILTVSEYNMIYIIA